MISETEPGAASTQATQPAGAPFLPPAGWYPAPGEADTIRWWDGAAWSEHRATPDRPTAPPVPAPAPPIAPALPLPVVLGLVVAGVPAMHVLGWLLLGTELLDGVPTAIRVGLALALEPLALTAPLVLVLRRSGRRLGASVGLRFARSDVWRGMGIGVVSLLSQSPVVALVIAISPRLFTSNVEGVSGASDARTAFLVAFMLAVLIAPIVEEILFRGALQPVLVGRFGARTGLVAASMLFGAAHISPWLGIGNVGLAVVLSVAGAVFGHEAHERGRLGTAIIGHATANAIVVTVAYLAWAVS